MQTATDDIDAGYLRRVYLASARRQTRSLLRALAVFLLVAGVVSLGIAALGYVAA